MAVTQTAVVGLTLGFIVAWLIVTLRIVSRYRQRGETQREETSHR
jgi:biopolymer transport protein ExbB/TolQ